MMKKAMFLLVVGLVATSAQGSDALAEKAMMEGAKYDCYRSLRAFVRVVYPQHVFVPNAAERWKKVDSPKEEVLMIEAEDYIKIKSSSLSEYQSHKAYCSYYSPSMSVISIGVSPPAAPE